MFCPATFASEVCWASCAWLGQPTIVVFCDICEESASCASAPDVQKSANDNDSAEAAIAAGRYFLKLFILPPSILCELNYASRIWPAPQIANLGITATVRRRITIAGRRSVSLVSRVRKRIVIVPAARMAGRLAAHSDK